MIPAPYPAVDGTQACADLDPETFFPVDKVDRVIDAPEAIQACRRCPFIRPCLAYALTHGVVGIWGGTTEQERAAIRRKHHIRADNTGLTAGENSVGDQIRDMHRGGGSGG